MSEARALPAGTITFLFTDIEGSTQRWDSDRAAMQQAVRRHDAILRSAIESHDGFVFKTIGDAFCAAFSDSQDAVAAALAAQRLLAAEDFSAVEGLRVRMALDTGTADERNADYFGPTVNRVARLLAIGHGEQILLSGVCANAVRERLPDRVTLLDMGRHRLKDLTEPEAVHQLVAADLRRDFPTLKSLDHLRHNVPQQLTSFVGRDAELAEVKALLQESRVVTLVGTGGVGKTRLALHVGADLIDQIDDGVWFAQLAPISDPGMVTSVIAAALGLQESLNRPMLETLLTFLKRKRVLLILDNCEHVVTEVAKITEVIVQACQYVTILATTREPLGVSGEKRYPMPALPMPVLSPSLRAADALGYGAIVLFAERAKDADRTFVLTDANAPVVAEICRRLDGIALAIELAASRVKMLPVEKLAQKLDERFRVLTGGSKAALPRQQTLRALIDWSYDLLSEKERSFFGRLSVFAGDFSIEMAAAVCADATIDELDVLDLLTSLVDKSLVAAEAHEDNRRYRLLDSMRHYGREKLAAQNEVEALADAHAAAYTALAERHAGLWYEMGDREWDRLTEPELGNWRAALDWTLNGNGDRPAGQRLAAALRQVYRRVSPVEGRRWVEAALKSVRDETPPQIVGRLEIANALLAKLLGLWSVHHGAAQRALEIFDGVEDARGLIEAQLVASLARTHAGQIEEGEILVRTALDASREQHEPRLTALALAHLKDVRSAAGDDGAARPLLMEMMEIDRQTGAERFLADDTLALAMLEFAEGNTDAALRLANDALAAFWDLRYPVHVTITLNTVASYEIFLGRWDDARWHSREALDLARELEDEFELVNAIENLVCVAVLRTGDGGATDQTVFRRVSQLIGYVRARWVELEVTVPSEWLPFIDRVLAALGAALGEDTLKALAMDGELWDQGKAIAEALLL